MNSPGHAIPDRLILTGVACVTAVRHAGIVYGLLLNSTLNFHHTEQACILKIPYLPGRFVSIFDRLTAG
jgi:hypothetical protein